MEVLSDIQCKINKQPASSSVYKSFQNCQENNEKFMNTQIDDSEKYYTFIRNSKSVDAILKNVMV